MSSEAEAERNRFELIRWAICSVIWLASAIYIFRLLSAHEELSSGWFALIYWFDAVGLWLVLTLKSL